MKEKKRIHFKAVTLEASRVDLFRSRLKRDRNGCLVYEGPLVNGYGLVPFEKNKLALAHRLAWLMERGPIAEKMVVHHLCGNRACAEVTHLEVLTFREALLRGNGLAAQHSRKTHCVNGHALTPENLYVSSNRGRVCKLCVRARAARYRQQMKEAENEY